MSGLFFVKLVMSALVIALASEVAKRDSFWGALLVADDVGNTVWRVTGTPGP